MNLSSMMLEITVSVLGLGVLLLDLWTPRSANGSLVTLRQGCCFLSLRDLPGAAASGNVDPTASMMAFDSLGWFFKRFFILAAILC